MDTKLAEAVSSEELLSMEKALASFYSAVADAYGTSEATKAALEWADEWQHSNGSMESGWRRVTILAASHLATRIGNPAG